MTVQRATNEQWEKLLQIIGNDQMPDARIRAKVLSFGAKIGLKYPDQLFQIRDQQTPITWPLAMQIYNKHLSIDPYWLIGLKQPSICGTVIGAWRYHNYWTFDNGLWQLQESWVGAREEYQFSEDNIVRIATRESNKAETYSYNPEIRNLQIGDHQYYVSKLTQSCLEIISNTKDYVAKIQFDRIPNGKLHIIQNQIKDMAPCKVPSENWLIDKEYRRGNTSEDWILINDYTLQAGFWVWGFTPHNNRIIEYKFGRCKRDQYGELIAPNVLHILFSKKDCYNGLIEFESKDSFWLYVLDDQIAMPANSLKKYHFIRWSETNLQALDSQLWWLEDHPIHAMHADKFPLEYLELWHKAANDTAALFDTTDFIECPKKYVTEQYAGAYAFLHAFNYNTKLRTAPKPADQLYRQFLGILDMWLQLREKGIIIKNIRLFGFNKYPEYINQLQAEIDQTK